MKKPRMFLDSKANSLYIPLRGRLFSDAKAKSDPVSKRLNSSAPALCYREVAAAGSRSGFLVAWPFFLFSPFFFPSAGGTCASGAIQAQP
jgi:hypothetical protein